jgi:hypothetical protein
MYAMTRVAGIIPIGKGEWKRKVSEFERTWLKIRSSGDRTGMFGTRTSGIVRGAGPGSWIRPLELRGSQKAWGSMK